MMKKILRKETTCKEIHNLNKLRNKNNYTNNENNKRKRKFLKSQVIIIAVFLLSLNLIPQTILAVSCIQDKNTIICKQAFIVDISEDENQEIILVSEFEESENTLKTSQGDKITNNSYASKELNIPKEESFLLAYKKQNIVFIVVGMSAIILSIIVYLLKKRK